MDDKRFDRITQALAADGSRRRVLGILAGGVAALAGAATLEAKRGKGKAKGRGNGGNGNGNGNGGNGQGRGRVKVTLCHRNNGKKGFNLITVGAPSVPAHERHGDVVCERVACQTVTGCGIDEESGEPVCTYEADAGAEGTECETDAGTGVCTDGECVVEDDGGTEG